MNTIKYIQFLIAINTILLCIASFLPSVFLGYHEHIRVVIFALLCILNFTLIIMILKQRRQ